MTRIDKSRHRTILYIKINQISDNTCAHDIYDILCDDISLYSLFDNNGLSFDFNSVSGETISGYNRYS